MTHLVPWTATAIAATALLGCGSQQLRLEAPETAAGIGYTCTSATVCYPASVATPPEGQQEDAILLALPRECHGHIHSIVVRDADSSSPQVDVTCARLQGGPPVTADEGVAAAEYP